jgi:hypothetical protein
MSNKLHLAAVCCALILSIPLTTHAVVNGDFETGTTAGWTVIGQGTTKTSSFGVTPTGGTRMGYIDTTGNLTVLPPPILTAFGLDAADIMGLAIGGAPTRGSAIYQDVTVAPGDVLTFDWNFVCDELDQSPTFNDYAFLAISDTASLATTSSAFFLASRNASTYNTVSPPPGFDGQTGWTIGDNYTFTSAGTFRVGFVTFNVGDSGVNSALLFDGVSVTPEPGTLALVLAPLAGLARRRRPDVDPRVRKWDNAPTPARGPSCSSRFATKPPRAS